MLRRTLTIAAAMMAGLVLPALAQDTTYPLTTHDMIGREVTIPAMPQRIVTTSPSAIELLYAAGGTAIGRSTTATGVPDAETITDIGGAYNPNFEAILQLMPDLVIADASAQPQLAGAFETQLAGVPTVYVGATRYADIPASIRLLGQIVNTEDVAEAAAADAEAVADEVAQQVAGEAPVSTLIVVAGRDGSLSVALPDSFIGDLVRIAGGANVAADVPQSGQVPGFAVVSPETIVQTNPDVILVIVPGQTGGVSIGQMISGMFPSLTAVQNGKVYEVDLETFLQNPGPRAIQGLRDLATLLHQ